MKKHYFKIAVDGFIVAVGYGYNENVISKEEHDDILSIIKTTPKEEGFVFKLKEDLTWEKFEVVEETETSVGIE